jgi:hypothetical protein
MEHTGCVIHINECVLTHNNNVVKSANPLPAERCQRTNGLEPSFRAGVTLGAERSPSSSR